MNYFSSQQIRSVSPDVTVALLKSQDEQHVAGSKPATITAARCCYAHHRAAVLA